MYRRGKMRKVIIGLMIFLLSTNVIYASVTTEFFEKLVKMTKGKADDIIKRMPKTTKNLKIFARKDIDANKLTPIIKKDPAKLLLANKAQKITNRGSFEKEFFNNQNFNNQLSMIVQSSKYGDEYFVIAKKISDIPPDVLKNNPQLLKYIPSGKLNQQRLQTKFIDTLNKTGKYGWERLKGMGSFIKKHPIVSSIGGAYTWFILDPNSFEEAIKGSTKVAVGLVAVSSIAVAEGVGEVAVEKTMETIEEIKNDINNSFDASDSYILKMISALLVLFVIFMLWRKRKVIKHFILKADEVKKEDTMNIKREKEDDEF